ncbi:MAG TPA: phosphotransferase family protein [Solirubrobacterales bacterium]|nr:phosphotransferase family protein [Solirubrobacterales bacterium]
MNAAGASSGDVVHTPAEAAAAQLEPLVVLEPLEAFLDGAGLGSGPLSAAPIGEGHSNVTYLIERGGEKLVLRRPPRGPLPPSAHDVLREARLLIALRPHGTPVPEVLATCDDPEVIGAPFYLMTFVDGWVLAGDLPAPLAGAGAPTRIGEELVDNLVELHTLGPSAEGLAGFGRPDGYLERQLKRFGGLLETNMTRPLPDLERVTEWLSANLPASPPPTVVHGDYRLGNVMYAPDEPRLAAILDWEMATIGDPLADVGYMTATWAGRDDPRNSVADLSPVTRLPGFPSRDDLARRYAERSGRTIEALGWYQVLAIWKAAIFLEGNYKRFVAGTTADPYYASLEQGVPELAQAALARAQGA